MWPAEICMGTGKRQDTGVSGARRVRMESANRSPSKRAPYPGLNCGLPHGGHRCAFQLGLSLDLNSQYSTALRRLGGSRGSSEKIIFATDRRPVLTKWHRDCNLLWSLPMGNHLGISPLCPRLNLLVNFFLLPGQSAPRHLSKEKEIYQHQNHTATARRSGFHSVSTLEPRRQRLQTHVSERRGNCRSSTSR